MVMVATHMVMRITHRVMAVAGGRVMVVVVVTGRGGDHWHSDGAGGEGECDHSGEESFGTCHQYQAPSPICQLL